MDRGAPRSFDVICAGEASWKLAPSSSARLRQRGGPVDIALALVREGLRVGLATVLADDRTGRASLERIAASGVDVGGVVLARPRAGFVLVDASGGASQVASGVQEEQPFEVPAGWSSRLLVLSGLSPRVPQAAALCKAARAARRHGALVLIDFDASLHAWAGQDSRTIRMILREVDVARCSLANLAVLGTDVATVRAGLRDRAVLLVSDGVGGAVATGHFGEVTFAPSEALPLRTAGVGDAFTAGICAESMRASQPGESVGAAWHRALRRGYAAAAALVRAGV